MSASPFTAQFPEGRQGSSWAGLHGSSRALALNVAARALKGAAHDGVVVVVARSSHQAHVLARDLELLSLDGPDVLLFPDHETLPYDPFSPHPDIISERVATLARLTALQRGIVLTSVGALAQRLPPVDFIRQRAFDLRIGQRLVMDEFRERLARAGYAAADQVHQSGQFAIRGSVIDLYPSGAELPYRIDLLDEDIDTIRVFDPETQRSTGQTDRIDLLPAREYPSDPEALDAFRRAFRMRFDVDTRNVTLYQDLRSGAHPQGLEQYLPLFFENVATASLFDYLAVPVRLVVQAGARQATADQFRRTTERWEQRRYDVERPVLEPAELFLTPGEVEQRLSAHPVTELLDQADETTDHEPRTASEGVGVSKTGAEAAEVEATDAEGTIHFDARPAPDLPVHEHGKEAAADLKEFLGGFRGQVLFAADSAGRREVLASTLASFGIRTRVYESFAEFHRSGAHVGLAVLPVETGFVTGSDLAVLTETQLFGGRARQRTRREPGERDPEAIIRNLADLQEGAPVVHEDHGVGRYLGLETLEIDDRPAEFLKLQYADDDRLYVPVSYLHLVSRYTGADPENAPLHRLGSKQWENARRKAAEKVRDVAAELLDLYARRQARPGFAFPLDEALYNEFAAGFPFEETPDQQQAIDAVVSDLLSEQPMDRVVCGDVGFGKTEVALRAAFVAVQAGRQVAVLVPTTLLAQQHFSTFGDRLADWPVKIELLSRFRGAKDTKETMKRLADGTVDIVIGTHRLLQRDVAFKQLGLLVIDEEHRFGVQQKERLKQLRAEVDVLTLTATPIPRTLNMAMSGIRDLSIIATPPARRMAVKTLISQWDKAVIREALYRELQRGGQVFFLHNEVRSIDRIAREVAELAPTARLAIAHGQMPEKELERVMFDFYRQRYNILVCTTIIESGIDVPTANTMIINRADRFGLAQLHQLRGRVGRSHHRAYAYLMVPDQKSMTADARKRLEAIASLEDLGAGFTLATHDLEIRGAGELLGAEQSGQIHEVGFSLYSDMLARAVDALRAGREPDLDAPIHRGIEVELHVPALIPEEYLGDVPSRLTLYKRIASSADEHALRELQVEMIDRFGLLPQPVKNLFSVAGLRLLADRIGIRRLDLGPNGGRLEFAEDARADPDALIALVQKESRSYRLEGPKVLRILAQEPEPERRFERASSLLARLGGEKPGTSRG